jgi:hypothetical protein
MADDVSGLRVSELRTPAVTEGAIEDDPTEPKTKTGRGLDPRLGWGLAAGLVLFVVVFAVLLALEVTQLRPQAAAAQADETNRADVTRVAEQFMVEVNNYAPQHIQAYERRLSTMLSPKFRGEFKNAMDDIVTQVKHAKLRSKGQVLASGVSSLDPDSADVLVVGDATVKTIYGTRARHFRWDVALVKIDGRWLVDNFTPVDGH